MNAETIRVEDEQELKIRVARDRWLNGKPLKTWTAHLGNTGWKATGQCKAGALGLLFADLRNAEENLHKRRYIRKGEVTFALYYAAGWQYDIIRPDGSFSSCMMLCASYRDAEARMIAHANQHDGV